MLASKKPSSYTENTTIVDGEHLLSLLGFTKILTKQGLFKMQNCVQGLAAVTTAAAAAAAPIHKSSSSSSAKSSRVL